MSGMLHLPLPVFVLQKVFCAFLVPLLNRFSRYFHLINLLRNSVKKEMKTVMVLQCVCVW